MNKKFSGILAAVGLVVSSIANATPVTFNFSSASAGGVSADFTVDVVGGLGVTGSGTLTSASFPGAYNLILLTANSTLSAGNGSINPTPGSPSYGLGSGFTWHGVTGSGGADFMGDTVVNSGGNYFDDYGLIFEVTTQDTGAIVGALNIWANSNSPNSQYATNLSVNGYNKFENSGNGILVDSSAVPEPGTLSMMLASLGLVGMIVRRKRSV